MPRPSKSSPRPSRHNRSAQKTRRAPKIRLQKKPDATRRQPIQTVAFVSLGCPKNLVDSEKMLGLLAESGLIPVSDHTQADAIVVNTCGFLEASKIESVNEITQAAKLKKGRLQRLVVAGCLVQRHRAKLLDWCPDIDALIGVFDRDRIIHAVAPQSSGGAKNSLTSSVSFGGTGVSPVSSPLPVYSSIAATALVAKRDRGISDPGYFESDSARLRLTPRHYTYLRISEGCNQNCAFCTIPSIRGKMRSKPLPALLAEARELLTDGAFELNLIGQDTTSFGYDIAYAPGLAGMLRELDSLVRREFSGSGWLRLMYAYPSCFTDEMIDALASLPTLVKYIDMPLQHINDRVLNAMRRNTSRHQIETLLQKLRTKIPGLALRTTFISGFPGETEEEHKELLKFIREFPGGFDALGVFPYSPEPGTPAGTMHAAGQAVAPEIIRQRIDELMLAQQERAFATAQHRAAARETFDVLIDKPASSKLQNTAISHATLEEPSVSSDSSRAGQSTAPAEFSSPVSNPSRLPLQGKGRLYQGRTYQQAVQIDSVTWVCSREKLSPGELVRCKITDSDGYDLIAQPIADLQPTEKRHSLPLLGGHHHH